MLSRILFAEDNVDTEFWRFIKPWETTLDRVTLAFEGGGDLGEEDIRVRRMCLTSTTADQERFETEKNGTTNFFHPTSLHAT